MTATEIDTMEAGTELDAAVCRAIADGEIPPLLHPSTDCDDAMFAAEEFGLFGLNANGYLHEFGRHRDGSWYVRWRLYDDGDDIATAPTPALCISRAILKLSQ